MRMSPAGLYPNYAVKARVSTRRSKSARGMRDHLVLRRRPGKKGRGPQMLTNERQRIRKGRQGFGIPGGLANRERVLIQQLMSNNGHERKQPQKSGGGTQNGQIRPLALGFHAPSACAPHER